MAVFINRVLKVSNKNIAYFEYSFCKVAYVDSLSVRIFYINYFWILKMSHKLSIIIYERLLCVFSHLLRVSSILFFFFFFNEIKGILRLKKNCKDRRVLLKAELLSVFYPSSTFTFFKDVATEKETPEARQEERL